MSTALPCASVLKPVYVALAQPQALDADALASIIRSDNDATDRIVGGLGGVHALLETLRETIPGLFFDFGRAPTWGRILVTVDDIERLYRAHVLHHPAVVEAMRAVAPAQRFKAPPGVPVKGGWDLWPADGDRGDHLVTHRVVLAGDRVEVASVRTPVDGWYLATWRDLLTDGPEAVISLHADLPRPRLGEGV